MAITRTAIVDDNGTGTTGTPIDNAWKTELYNQIDAMFSSFGSHDFVAGGTGANLLAVRNTTAGASNYAGLLMGNDGASDAGSILSFSTTFGTSGINIADSFRVATERVGGLSIGSMHASGVIRFYTGGSAAGNLRATLGVSGGLQMGAPTGGDKGSGTINLAGDVYKNNTAYTNPDYVFELWATGKIRQFAQNPGAKGYRLRALTDVERYARRFHRLPGVHQAKGMFARADVQLEKTEELFIHLFELQRRIAVLEGKAA